MLCFRRKAAVAFDLPLRKFLQKSIQRLRLGRLSQSGTSRRGVSVYDYAGITGRTRESR
jgi:hypothetical protein